MRDELIAYGDKLDLTRPDNLEKSTNKGITGLKYSNGLELQFSRLVQLQLFSRYVRILCEFRARVGLIGK